jgi:ketosteroid isomerase-like protein
MRQTLALAVLTAFAGVMTPMVAQAPKAPSQVAAVENAVEALRVAMVAGDEKVLKALTDDHLTYGHSHGNLQDKGLFVKTLVGPNAEGKFNWIKLSGQTIDVVGDTALVRHVFDAENLPPDGKITTAHILVLQVWKHEKASWKLLARQACPL